MASNHELSPFGRELRRWRKARACSQLELAVRAATSPRHVSFLETGRSRPGRELVLRLATALDVPLDAQNQLLVAAGLPAIFAATPLDDEQLAPIQRIIDRVFATHEPYPAILMQRGFRLLRMNQAAHRMFPGLLELSPEARIDSWFGPGPARDAIVNWRAVAWSGVVALRRELSEAPDPELAALVRRAEAHLADAGITGPPNPAQSELPVVCPHFRFGDQTIRTISSVMRFDTAHDITAAQLRLELMFPADATAEAFFDALAATPPG